MGDGDTPPFKLVETCEQCGARLSPHEDAGLSLCGKCRGTAVDSEKQESSESISDELFEREFGEQYELLGLLEQNPRFRVYKVRDRSLETQLLIKVLEKGYSDPLIMRPIETVVKSLVELSHPYLLTIYDTRITSSGNRYLIMDDPGERTVESLIAEEGFIELDRALDLFCQACEALTQLHSLGIVHGSIRPRSFAAIKSETGLETMRVTNYGITSYSVDDMNQPLKIGRNYTCNDAFYISPEEIKIHHVDARTDVYSLGCVIFHAITGKPVYRSRELDPVLSQHTDNEKARFRRRYEIPEPVQEVVLHALEKIPEKRYQTVKDLHRDLLRVMKGKQPIVDNLWRRLNASTFEKE